MGRSGNAAAAGGPSPATDVTVHDSCGSSSLTVSWAGAATGAAEDGTAQGGAGWTPTAAAAAAPAAAGGGGGDALAAGRRPPIHYGTLVWVVYGTFTVLAMVDRFTTNVWPRQGFRIGAGTAGSDFLDPIKPGPWSVGFYDAVARLSGRYSICALNLLFATMMKTTLAAAEASWIGRWIIDFRGAAAANAGLHKWNGIGLAVFTLVHVWSIFTPVVFHGYAARVVLGAFEWPLSERAPPGFKDANPLTRTVMLQGDDVFRIVEMTLLLGVALPLSVRWLASRWHVGTHLHSFIAVAYFIDIVRRHTHPHSWVLNTPFFLAWLADLAVGRLWWRAAVSPVAVRRLSPDYAVLTWAAPAPVPPRCVGPTVHLRLPGASLWERAHPFTAFANRGGAVGPALAGGGTPWTVGLVVRVYHRRRWPVLGVTETVSHTHRIADAAAVAASEAAASAAAAAVVGDGCAAGSPCVTIRLGTWGPTHGEATAAVAAAVARATPARRVVLVASGSAIAYLLDAAQVVALPEWTAAAAPVTLLYTVRDEALLRWAVAALADIAASRGGWSAAVTVAYTGAGGAAVVADVRRDARARVGVGSGAATTGMRGVGGLGGAATAVPTDASAPIDASTPTATTDSSGESGGRDTDGQRSGGAGGASDGSGVEVGGGKAGKDGAGLKVHTGRLRLAAAMPRGGTVFFQGSAGLRSAVAAAARSAGARLVAGGTFDGEGAPTTKDGGTAAGATGAGAV